MANQTGFLLWRAGFLEKLRQVCERAHEQRINPVRRLRYLEIAVNAIRFWYIQEKAPVDSPRLRQLSWKSVKVLGRICIARKGRNTSRRITAPGSRNNFV